MLSPPQLNPRQLRSTGSGMYDRMDKSRHAKYRHRATYARGAYVRVGQSDTAGTTLTFEGRKFINTKPHSYKILRTKAAPYVELRT